MHTLNFKCNNCGCEQYTVETTEEYWADEVDTVRVFIECDDCRGREEIEKYPKRSEHKINTKGEDD